MRIAVHKRIADLDARQWNALNGTHIPFLRHEFLAALERTGCVGSRTGWEPRYLTLSDSQGLAAAAPAFAKSHSYGEFVFDFAWAQAYARVGRNYYPKLTVAVPFTPASGPRLLIRKDLDAESTAKLLIAAIEEYSAEHALSSAHALFLDEPGRVACERAGWLLRRDCQFHWSNRGYASFDAFLETFTAEKRKKAKRERRRVAEAGITFETRSGGELDGRLLDRVYAFHRDTFLRHGHEPYLTKTFFAEIARTLGDALMVKVAMHSGKPVAAAIFFRSDDTLYGRYWGSAADYHSLHFETCYHQGIEFCIENGLARFEPGTQGEHKVARGFEPVLTWSAHYIADRRFRSAIDDYLGREGAAIDEYAEEVRAHVPFRGTP
ncbi:MAG TPA: GNAT family N-acetyltransferase [Steroidobacteraceae bacterium]|jgi:predicted N-acyltransferase|nr:GNAT family N-acetyltransferase [Steroidobacteraceae bacterium]